MSMLYSNDYVWLTSYGKVIPIKEWEDIYSVLISEEKPYDTIPTYELHTIFPEAKSRIKEIVKEDTQALGKILAKQEVIKKLCYKHCQKLAILDCMEEVALEWMGEQAQREVLEARIKKNSTVLNNFKNPRWVKRSIPKAKAVPIDTILQFDRAGFTNCIWHEERTPSLKYYPKENRVHCFGSCNRNGDVIDVAEVVFKMNTTQAIRKLCNL